MHVLKWTGLVLLGGTVLCWGAFALIGSTVEPDGTLREPFVLVPIGWLFLFAAVVVGAVYLVSALMARRGRGRSELDSESTD
jgi:hypothetical protein